MESENREQSGGAQDSSPRSRGFAAMNQERQREIARKGGRAAHAKGTAHEFTSDEARSAGQKGGQRVSVNREHMSRIGRIGGKKSAGKRMQNRDAGSPDAGPSSARHGEDAEGSSSQVEATGEMPSQDDRSASDRSGQMEG
jgi:general stress protein YciG